MALEFGEAGGDFSFSTAYTGSAEAAARPKYIDFPADAEVVKRLRKLAILRGGGGSERVSFGRKVQTRWRFSSPKNDGTWNYLSAPARDRGYSNAGNFQEHARNKRLQTNSCRKVLSYDPIYYI